jgi:hypothetical protein
MLVWLLQTQKEVRIERLVVTLQLPILQSSRRRHIQRFLQINPLLLISAKNNQERLEHKTFTKNPDFSPSVRK